EGVLRHRARPDAGRPPGQRRGSAIPLGHLLRRREAARGGPTLHGPDRARGHLRRAARHRARAARGLPPGRGLSPRLRGAEPEPTLRPGRRPAQGREGAGVQGAHGGVPMSTRSESGFDLTPPSADARSRLEGELTPEAAAVLLRHGTEAPFCGTLLNEKRPGVFTCGLCGLPLFLGGEKFESGTGWPSFTAPFDAAHLHEKRDTSFGMVRIEL